MTNLFLKKKLKAEIRQLREETAFAPLFAYIKICIFISKSSSKIQVAHPKKVTYRENYVIILEK